jgi:hypothetical protein
MDLLKTILESHGGNTVNQLSNQFGLEGILTSFLDQDGDGSVVDDLMGKFPR